MSEKLLYGHLVLIGLMTAGCIGIDYKRILKLWTKVIAFVLLVTFFLASVRAIENLVYYSGGIRLKLRGSLGMVFTTDCASLVLFLIMGLWMSYKKISNSFILILSTALPAMMAGIMLFLMNQYKKGTSIGIKSDKLLDIRVSLGANALKEYGIKLFGTNFEMVGGGGGLLSNRSKYNFLDSSYINVLIRYGIVMFIILIVIWLVVMKKAIKINDRRVLMVILENT
ncbi:hypothetical protein QYZ88_007430 [Lachnospiraceae bacterium C1.1]|nr:hypothetical protein [Lachnospiraceae bacterium C1.1]